jgi:hypothetical protein
MAREEGNKRSKRKSRRTFLVDFFPALGLEPEREILRRFHIMHKLNIKSFKKKEEY